MSLRIAGLVFLLIHVHVSADESRPEGGPVADRARDAITLDGRTSDFTIQTQDGTGRVSMYWGAQPGKRPTFLNDGEDAFKLRMSTGGEFDLQWADAGGARAGDAITWSPILNLDSSVVKLHTEGKLRLLVDGEGNVGIGAAGPLETKLQIGDALPTPGFMPKPSATHLFWAARESDDPESNPVAVIGVEQTSATTESVQGLEAYAVTANPSGDVSFSAAAFTNLEHKGSGTLSEGRALQSTAFAFNSGSASKMIGVKSAVNAIGTGNIVDGMAFHASTLDAAPSGVLTNGYGLYVDDIDGLKTWGVYQADPSDDNYFAGRVGIGDTTPSEGMLTVGGTIHAEVYPNAVGSTPLCRDDSGGSRIGTCTSLARYKDTVRSLSGEGQRSLAQLRPVTFRWQGRDRQRIGLVAEEVEAVDPRLATYDGDELAGVDYDAIVATLVAEVQALRRQVDFLSEQSARTTNELCADP